MPITILNRRAPVARRTNNLRVQAGYGSSIGFALMDLVRVDGVKPVPRSFTV